MKKVVWGAPKIASVMGPGKKPLRSFKQEFAKALEREQEQNEALEYLQKAMPAMVALLEYKLNKNEPLLVMRPLQYMTSVLAKDDEDDGFYNNSKSQAASEKFVDKVQTIFPGTQLTLKSLDIGLEEFVFQDGKGKEHAISFSDRNRLLTQTSIFEEVKQFLAHKETNK